MSLRAPVLAVLIALCAAAPARAATLSYRSIDVGGNTQDTAIADVDFDADNDLIALGDPSAGNNDAIRIRRQLEDHSFATTQRIPLPTSTWTDVAAADLDGDFDADIAVLQVGSSAAHVFVLINHGGEFGPLQDVPVGGPGAALAVADVNNDGASDLAVAGGPSGVAGTLRLLFGAAHPDGTIDYTTIAPTQVSVGQQPVDVLIADVRAATGGPEVVTANSGSSSLSIAPVAAQALQTPSTIALSSAPFAVAAGSLDAVFGNDLAVSRRAGNAVDVLFNDADAFTDVVPLTVNSPGEAAIADADGDGHGDLYVMRGSTFAVFRSPGDRTFAAPQLVTNGGSAFQKITLGDIDGDGFIDVSGGSPSTNDPGLAAALAPLARFVPATTAPVDFGSRPVGLVGPPVAIEVHDDGFPALPFSGVSVTGTDSADFIAGPGSCLSFIQHDGSCTVTVRFAPSGEGPRSATLKIATRGTATFTITGTGAPQVAGPQGPAGAAGLDGAAGAQGLDGAAGAQGLAGVAGTTGAPGPGGATGATGARGPAGPAAKVTCKLVNARRVRCTVTVKKTKATRVVLRQGTRTVARARGTTLRVARLRPGRYTLLALRGTKVVGRTPVTLSAASGASA